MASHLISQLEILLKNIEGVKDFFVEKYSPKINTFSSSSSSIIAYVVPNREILGSSETDSEWSRQWGLVYDISYGDSKSDTSKNFDISCWKNSYDGSPMDVATMSEWVDETVIRINGLISANIRPKILEIGCGTGLIAHRIIEQCDVYIGVDVSSTAVDRLRADSELNLLSKNVRCCKFIHKSAHEISEKDLEFVLEEGGFDLIIVNSVLMYFPNIDYLIQFLDQSIKWLSPNGSIFLGDIRSLNRLAHYHASVVSLGFAEVGNDLLGLKSKIRNQINHENELLLSPDFAGFLTDRFKSGFVVGAQIRRGKILSEMTKFRFDMVVKKTDRVIKYAPTTSIDGFEWDLKIQLQLIAALNESSPRIIVSNLLDKRLFEDLQHFSKIGLHKNLDLNNSKFYNKESYVDPEELWALAKSKGYTLAIVPMPNSSERLQAIFSVNTLLDDEWELSALGSLLNVPSTGSFAKLSNNPLKNKRRQKFTKLLERKLSRFVKDLSDPVEIIIIVVNDLPEIRTNLADDYLPSLFNFSSEF